MGLFAPSKPHHLQVSSYHNQAPPKGQPWSVPIPGSATEGRSAVYRNWRATDKLMITLDDSVKTVHDQFEKAVAFNPSAPMLGHRPYNSATKTYGPYEYLDYGTVAGRRKNFGVGIKELHAREGITKHNFGVGIWCPNRPEWQIVDLGCMSQSLYTVSLYDTLGPETSEFIIRHADLACVVTSLAHVPLLLKLQPRLPNLKFIVIVDSLSPATNEEPELSKKKLLQSLLTTLDSTCKIFSIEEVEALGAKLDRPMNPPSVDDLVTINYTSGTTGDPKGVVLTHYAAVAATAASLIISGRGIGDSIVSYLPLAHIYGRLLEHSMIYAGAKIAYFHGDTVALVDDLKTAKPTLFVTVPRLLNRFGGVIKASTVEAEGFKGALSRHIVNTKTANLNDKDNPTATHAIYDRIWGSKVAAAIGLEKTVFWCSGSAPLDPAMQQFFQAVTGQRVSQGFGMTETYAIATAQLNGDMKPGTCGGLLPTVEMCLASVPDMEYTAEDKPYPRGEVMLRGPNVFKYYHKNDEETAKTFTEDGWFRTGDIGQIDEMGRLSIIDRKKNVLKLAQGEYISPERIEGMYLSDASYLAQGFVHGDSVQTFLVAMFGVQPDLFAPWASKILGREIKEDDIPAIQAACKDPKIKAACLKDLDRIGRKNKFAGYERVRNITLDVEPFTLENELLTPTLKLKRSIAARRFRDILDQLYAEALEDEKKAAMKAKL